MKSPATVPAQAVPWAQTASGRALPLGRAIEPGGLDIRRDVGVPLGNTGRFANQTASGILYSVAQHCCIGADWIMAQTFDYRLAMAFLIHDAPEGPLGDWTTPVLQAMQMVLDEMRREAGHDLVPRISMAAIKKRISDPIDRYVHAEAGLPWPLPREIASYVHLIDRRMLKIEREHLLARPPRAWDAGIEQLKPLPLKQRIKPMSSAKAAENWINRFEDWSARLHADRGAGQGSLMALASTIREAAE
ncbi:conserved hypothetical protein [Bosea sp. 62]|uniref:hypothetical protein n=1 Tax=unclassified Bosea (in: a-proteobacteria) TaxID=2653178 RepID=UPI00125C7AE6|nr:MULTISPECIES: hypothetical protein [unclassified Bosea (in: a-proteobacteria)]CAD5255989.1 conserved hypothetical protein [Bosea sp. 7B]CAD5274709.1 conserved hypothetical protein [Bosea sp. 21B]CAD5275891.1 conserved hypothetical protein [Bosea sp. 46]VVT60071.1 conserved hypothetical protein [Bosea sp. EC-HK365B]VXB53919.1 conserved hypothetical protein [Bosea sp. 62]